ncbi:MAG: DNA polymerase III subunit gamma/tau [Anaerovoracaceae bacterium]|jgi:DNA polymerase-3 subunit gamma/tau
MYKALYRRYRPETFDEVIGQDHIVKVLKSQIAQDSVSHAYLFCGTRGTGKTTMARLLAKGVNCLSDGERPCGTCENCRAIKNGSFVDLIEIDAASNRGIDDIRNLRESVNYTPAIGRRKIYIIDEVHMLTKEAVNALLKTLEEPPGYVMFILCTTEPDSLLPTILSRCIRFDFRSVPEDKLAERMRFICDDLGVRIDEEALHMIAVQADGSARDGLTLLDQCIAGRNGEISLEDVLDSLGAVGTGQYLELTDAIIRHDVAGGLMLIDGMMRAGRDARQILQGLMTHYRRLLLATFIEEPHSMLGTSPENARRIQDQALRMDVESINHAIIEIAEMIQTVKRSSQPRVILEMCFVKLATYSPDGSVVAVKTAVPKAPPQRPEISGTPEAGPVPEPPEAAGAGSSPAQARTEMPGPEPAPEQQPVHETPEDDFDFAGIWTDTVNEVIERSEGHMVILLKNTAFIGADDTEFRISGSTMAADAVNDCRQILENTLASHCGGKRRKIAVVTEQGPAEERVLTDEEIEKVAEKAEAVLGLHVDTE